VGTSEGKRLLAKPICGKADNIQTDLEGLGFLDEWGGGILGWIHLA
jgi:hypothetical protein